MFKTGHNRLSASGNVSNHYYGRAVADSGVKISEGDWDAHFDPAGTHVTIEFDDGSPAVTASLLAGPLVGSADGRMGAGIVRSDLDHVGRICGGRVESLSS